MPGSPAQKYHPPTGGVGTGPVGDANGVAVATIGAVRADGVGCSTPVGDPLGSSVSSTLSDRLELGYTPELDVADRCRPVPVARPTATTKSTTARADPTATSHRREAVGDGVQLSLTAVLSPAELGLQTPPELSRFQPDPPPGT
jgi:hypothetical protein